MGLKTQLLKIIPPLLLFLLTLFVVFLSSKYTGLNQPAVLQTIPYFIIL